MKTFYLTVEVNLSVEVPIEAETVEEAIKKAQSDYYELPNLNDGNIYDTIPTYLRDENYNLLENLSIK